MSAPDACVLPPELLLHVLDSLVPPASTVALRPSDPAVKTILAFTCVSRLTYPPAIRHLYSRCLFIDSENRLRLLLIALETLLAPGRCASTLPHVDLKPRLTSMYFAPFPPRSIDSQPIAQWTFELFAIMKPSLKRLVINMPFDTMPPELDHLSVIPKLESAFSQLDRLEDFVSCGQFPYHTWIPLQNLKNILLRGTYIEDLMPFIKPEPLSNIEHMILATPALRMPWSRRDFFQEIATCQTKFILLHEVNNLQNHWKAIDRWVSLGMGSSSEDQETTQRNECVEQFCLPKDPRHCTEWLLDRALEGKLWTAKTKPEPQLVSTQWEDEDYWPRFPDGTVNIDRTIGSFLPDL
ncbi:hypothetical protein GTA08_BOTSDO06290 [Botryosphaeria dothidea]|uniref:Uncharacterized protein n=1 Tax=Botryosphaeria dothidea TaxID=55169 RepID=A0A8H4IRI8_9PEZI|nr:hypothetical protein GTA08_BOTSDO10209 [Botryosphaeria dothidea]KAF4304883.1 hypothetical protein GTA08_BOTSDO06290 [Botryosphaeria dothidea]